ncbi:MAG TPA: hypothetical protein PKV16_04570 [Caldisericia bacterium]|nr:hypothetical protein [Caldisericia bacterium]HPF48584.1 hypothetical protein [Caldisericia bacterium]HPI83756.1 hypothetical protein [Caldisericia bacterium]HPQ93039.1 hypothetical protein [Caldisericia bacterium]HRV75128.1 hypothetical protein [Caldisericia bacterium]
MTSIQTIPGLPKVWAWVLTLLPSSFLFWLPIGFVNTYLVIILAIVSVAVIYPLVSLLPRPRMLMALSEDSLLMLDNQVHNSEVTLLELQDSCSFGGWYVNLYTKWGDAPTVSIPLSQTENGDAFLSLLPKRMPSATLVTKGLVWGKTPDWILILVITFLLLGLSRFFILLFV